MQKAAPEPAQRFWDLWQQGPTPDLAQFIGQLGPISPTQLAAVVCVDLRERWRSPDRRKAEEYLRLFPELQNNREAAIDVVYCEFLLREELGEGPSPGEYSARFPDLSGELGQQIEMHRLIESDVAQKTLLKATIAEARPPAQPGRWPELPGYEILGRLGQGGMGVVYKAWQERLNRIVAVKMLHAGAEDTPDALARLRIEGEAIARLQHPNIVHIHEVGEHDGRPFLVMEFADAGNLAKRLSGTPWEPRKAAELAETLARAVHYAHQRGVLHRDLTPGNVVMFTDGTPKLSDFGLAKLMVGGNNLTQTGAVIGTPSYMSPEQAAGTSREAGPGVDVYSLGAILYELLTGRPPFKAASPLETLALVIRAEPVPSRQLQPAVPRDLDTICLKCLRKEPARRYGSALELADDLRRFLNNEPIRARPVNAIERFWRWSLRNPGWAAAMVLVVLTAVGSVIAAYVLAFALTDSQRAHARTKQELYRSKVSQARAKRLSGRIGQRQATLTLLDEARKLAGELGLSSDDRHALRNEVIACLALPDLELVREWDGAAAGPEALDFDDSLTLYARSDVQGKVTVRRMDSDAEVAGFPGTGEPSFMRFAPDSKQLAIFSGGILRLWPLGAEPAKTPLLEVPVGPGESANSHFSFGLQGRQVAVLLKGRVTVVIHDAVTGKELKRLRQDEVVRRLAFHPTRPILALAEGNSIVIVNLQGEIPIQRLPHPDKVFNLAWGANGQVLVSACDDKVLRLWEFLPPEPPRLVNQFSGPRPQNMELMLNHDGSLLAGSNWTGTLRLWDTHSGQQLVMPLAIGGVFRFAADDDLLACNSPAGKLCLYRPTISQEFRRLPAYVRYREASYRALVFHPRGGALFGSGEDGLTCWDMFKFAKIPAKIPALKDGKTNGWMVPFGFDDSENLLATSATGYQRWQHAYDVKRPGWIGMSNPRLLAPPVNGLKADYAGGTLVIAEQDKGARVFFPETSRKEMQLGPLKHIRHCAVSPDGRWIATGTNDAPGQPGAVIWDAATGKRVRDIAAVPRLCDVDFSPDGRWLLTTGGGCRLWKVSDWSPGISPGGSGYAFTKDGKLLAVEGEEGTVRLLNPDDGAEYARLTAPSEIHSLPACFSPDRSLLVVFGTENQALQVWDLRAVRERLRSLGLDWDTPPLPPAPAAVPIQVEFTAP